MPTHLDRDSLIKIPVMGEHVATYSQYFSWFSDITKDHILHNIGLFRRYLNVINKHFNPNDEGFFDSVHASANLADFHPELLMFFYQRVYKRLLFTIRKRKVTQDNYFNGTPSKNDARVKDLVSAIKEEIETAITLHDTKLTADKARQALDDEEVNRFKRENHSIHIKKHALPFKITETVLGAGTKINSTTKRMDTTSFFQRPAIFGHNNPPHMATLHPPHLLDLVPKPGSSGGMNKQWGISPTSLGFQVTGIVFSGLWLIYNVFSIAYHKKKENRKIFSFDNMREALPSLLFLPLGLVALLTPIGMWLSIVFAVHSILDVGYKIFEHIKYRRKVNADIAANAAEIEKLKSQRANGADKVDDVFDAFKNLDLADEAGQSKKLADAASSWQTNHETENKKLFDALTMRDKLIIEKANKSNNFAAFSYSTRTIIAIISAVGLGLTLSMVPPLMFIGSMILVATTCVTTIIFIPQIINRFYMHNKINQMKQKKMDEYGVSTAALFFQLEVHFDNFRQNSNANSEYDLSDEDSKEAPKFMPTDDIELDDSKSTEAERLLEKEDAKPTHPALSNFVFDPEMFPERYAKSPCAY